MKLSIIIPVYNEEKTLNDIYQKLIDVKFPTDLELIFVDDCSKDASRKIIEEIEKKDSRVKSILKEKNEGKGSALYAGFEKATGDIVIVQDADLEYCPTEIPKLIQLIVDDKADVVYGSRFSSMSTQVVKFYHYLGNKFLTLISNLFTNLRLTDMETCYKAFRADIIKNIIIENKRFGFEPEVTAKISKLDIRIHELPISYNQRSYSEGKKIGIKDGFEAIWCILKFNLFNNISFKKDLPEKFLHKKSLFS